MKNGQLAYRNDDSSNNVNIETPIDHNFHQLPSDKVKRWESTLPPAYWEYRRRWVEDPKSHSLRGFPIHLDVEATSTCNLRCVMCPRTTLLESGEFWKLEVFDFDMYTKLIDEGVREGLCSVKYNFLGEPTLNPRLVEMIEYAKKAGVVDVMFNTNGTMLTEELSRKIILSGVDKVFFSFDSPYREQYNKIRIGADYDKVLANIRRFMQIRQELGRVKPFTRASMVRMKDNNDEWEAFRALFEPLVDAVAYDDYLDHTGQKANDRTVVTLGKRKNKFCCPQLWQRMFVHPDGLVTPCCTDAKRVMVMGNVKEQSPSAIWTGEKYQALRALHISGRYDENPVCASCPLAQY